MTGPADTIRNTRDGPLEITDFEEFAAQYRRAYPRLTLIAAAITRDASQAEDIVQEAALIAVSKRVEYRSGSNFTSWLAAIVRRCALNHRRKVRTRKTYAADPADLAQQADRTAEAQPKSPDVATSGEILPHQTSFDDELLHALDSLSDEARCCLLLRVVQRLSYAEIAELLEIPEGTAMSHVHRSKHALRKRLSEQNLSDHPVVGRKV